MILCVFTFCFRDWLQDDIMKINTDEESVPVWIPFSVKVKLLEDGNLKIEEVPDDEPTPEQSGILALFDCDTSFLNP